MATIETSIFLAKIIGLFGAISTLAILVRYKRYLEIEEDATRNPVMIYVSGFFILIIGVLLTVSHQVWTLDWRVLITIIGWLTFLKGTLRILFPETIKKLIKKKKYDRRFLLAEVTVLLVSLYLVYQGFIVH